MLDPVQRDQPPRDPVPRAAPPLDRAAAPSERDLSTLLLRALTTATTIVLVVATVVGAVIFALLRALPAESLVYYAAGVAAALFAGMLALFLHGRFLDPRASAPFARDGRLLATRLQSLLAAAFGAKLAVLVLGVLIVRQLGAKFAESATFAITFAGGALLCQLVTAAVLARSVQRRSASSASASPASSVGGGNP